MFNNSDRSMTLALLRNLGQSFLEGTADRVDELVETLSNAPVCISLRKEGLSPQLLEVCFVLDATFDGRHLKMTSYVYNSTINRIAKLLGMPKVGKNDLSHNPSPNPSSDSRRLGYLGRGAWRRWCACHVPSCRSRAWAPVWVGGTVLGLGAFVRYRPIGFE